MDYLATLVRQNHASNPSASPPSSPSSLNIYSSMQIENDRMQRSRPVAGIGGGEFVPRWAGNAKEIDRLTQRLAAYLLLEEAPQEPSRSPERPVWRESSPSPPAILSSRISPLDTSSEIDYFSGEVNDQVYDEPSVPDADGHDRSGSTPAQTACNTGEQLLRMNAKVHPSQHKARDSFGVPKVLRDVKLEYLRGQSPEFYSPGHIWMLARSLHVLSRYYCSLCSPTVTLEGGSVNDFDRKLARLSWDTFSIPKMMSVTGDQDRTPQTPATKSGKLTVPQAIWVVLLMIYQLRVLEAKRRNSAPPITLHSTLSTLVGTLAFQDLSQSHLHKASSCSPTASKAGCCSFSGFCSIALEPNCNNQRRNTVRLESASDAPMRVKRESSASGSCGQLALRKKLLDKCGRQALLGACSRFINEVKLNALFPARALSSAKISESRCQVFTDNYVYVRDCTAVLGLLRHFCFSLFVGSAWVDEQEPLSTTTLCDFLVNTQKTLLAYRPCRQRSEHHLDGGDQQEMSRKQHFRKLAAATASSLYSTVTPSCLQGQGILESVSNSSAPCGVCGDAGPLQDSVTALRGEFERSLFTHLASINYDTRIGGPAMGRIGFSVLGIMEDYIEGAPTEELVAEGPRQSTSSEECKRYSAKTVRLMTSGSTESLSTALPSGDGSSDVSLATSMRPPNFRHHDQ